MLVLFTMLLMFVGRDNDVHWCLSWRSRQCHMFVSMFFLWGLACQLCSLRM